MAAIDSLTPATNAIWKRWFTAPAGLTRGEERVYATMAVGALSALLIHVFYIFLFASWGVRPLAIFNIFSVILWMAVIILLKHQRFVLVSVLYTYRCLSFGIITTHSFSLHWSRYRRCSWP
jgi:hypothetical protein